MCDIIWCKKEKDGKACDTVNYLDPYCFWNWEGKIACAGCNTVYYIHMINGHMYTGPDEKAGEQPDIRPCMPTNRWKAILPFPREPKARPDPTIVCPGKFTWAGRIWSSSAFGAVRCVAGGHSRPPQAWLVPAVFTGTSRSCRRRSGPSITKRSPKAK